MWGEGRKMLHPLKLLCVVGRVDPAVKQPSIFQTPMWKRRFQRGLQKCEDLPFVPEKCDSVFILC